MQRWLRPDAMSCDEVLGSCRCAAVVRGVMARMEQIGTLRVGWLCLKLLDTVVLCVLHVVDIADDSACWPGMQPAELDMNMNMTLMGVPRDAGTERS